MQETQETIHKSELVSLQVSLATLHVSLATALSKIETLERQYIAPLQAAVTTLDGENKILRWDNNRRIAAIQANEEAVTKKNDSVLVEGGTLGAIGKQDKGFQLKGLAVLLGFFFLLAAILRRPRPVLATSRLSRTGLLRLEGIFRKWQRRQSTVHGARLGTRRWMVATSEGVSCGGFDVI